MKQWWLTQCVRCGLHLREEPNKLWCKKCRAKVQEEFDWIADRPFQYYFAFNLKRMRHDNRRIERWEQKIKSDS